MGRPERGALRPLALLLLLLLLRLQHLAAAATDPLLGGQGACGRFLPRLCAALATNKARPRGRGRVRVGGVPEPGGYRGRRDGQAPRNAAIPEFGLCPPPPRASVLRALPSGQRLLGKGCRGAWPAGNFAEGEAIHGSG